MAKHSRVLPCVSMPSWRPLGFATWEHIWLWRRVIFEKGLVQITPAPGVMLMFPSYLGHTVYPFIGEGERRCVAFNASYRIVEPSGEQKKGEPLKGNIIAGNLWGVKNHYFYFDEKPNE